MEEETAAQFSTQLEISIHYEMSAYACRQSDFNLRAIIRKKSILPVHN